MIDRLRSRDDFLRLRRNGRRYRSDPLWCSFLHDVSMSHTRVAFAIGRATGNAVARNRLRRRIRAILAETELPPGLMLFGSKPAAIELSFDQIASTVGVLVGKLGTS